MHSVSPYVFRCFNRDLRGVDISKRYDPLDKIGQFDLYKIIKDYIEPKNGKGFTVLTKPKQIYRFNNFIFEDTTRRIRGLFISGKYGHKADIINVATGNVDYTKLEENAEVIEYFVDILLPFGMNDGICFLFNHNGDGVKTLLYSLLAQEFTRVTTRHLQMNPLPYASALKEWAKAKTKEIKLIKFNQCQDIADRLSKLGHGEQLLIISSDRGKDLGTLEDFLTQGSEENLLVEMLSPMCEEVRTKVEINGRSRTFSFGRKLDDQVCQILLDDSKVPLIAGNPDIPSLIKWCNDLMREMTNNLYPGVTIKI